MPVSVLWQRQFCCAGQDKQSFGNVSMKMGQFGALLHCQLDFKTAVKESMFFCLLAETICPGREFNHLCQSWLGGSWLSFYFQQCLFENSFFEDLSIC